MNIQLYSDLHIEFEAFEASIEKADVLAGGMLSILNKGVKVMNVKQYGAGVFTVSEVLDTQECIDLIRFSEGLGFDDVIMEDIKPKEELYRENDRVFFKDEKLAETLYQRIEKFLPKEIDGW